MGNNYEVYFSIKLTGNQFGQKKNQGLFFNHLEGEKKHLKLRRNVLLLIISLVHTKIIISSHINQRKMQALENLIKIFYKINNSQGNGTISTAGWAVLHADLIQHQ